MRLNQLESIDVAVRLATGKQSDAAAMQLPVSNFATTLAGSLPRTACSLSWALVSTRRQQTR